MVHLNMECKGFTPLYFFNPLYVQGAHIPAI